MCPTAKALIISTTVWILLVYGCTKDKQNCTKQKCETEHTGTILFIPPYEGLYRVSVMNDSNDVIESAYIDSEYTSGVLDSVFSSDVPLDCYRIHFLYWISSGYPDSIFNAYDICVEECDTFKVKI